MHKQSSGLLVGRILGTLSSSPILSHLRRTAGSPLWVREIGDTERDGAPDTPGSACAPRRDAYAISSATPVAPPIHCRYTQTVLHPHFSIPGAVRVRRSVNSQSRVSHWSPPRLAAAAPTGGQDMGPELQVHGRPLPCTHTAFISVLTSRVLDATRTECILFRAPPSHARRTHKQAQQLSERALTLLAPRATARCDLDAVMSTPLFRDLAMVVLFLRVQL